MMDYRKFIKSRELRIRLLRLLSFIPDKAMIKIQYKIKTGHKLDLRNPKRFTEKLQWYKLYYKNPLMIKCVDKYDVREYVKSKGLENILIPCYGVYDSVDEVNWEKLPSRFVLKDTLGSGGNSVVVINGTEKIDIDKLKERAKEWTLIDEHRPEAGREWPYYSGKKHRILIEEYLEAENDDIGLVDYKFFCFDGVVKWVYVIADRVIGKGAAIGIYNEHFVKQKVSRNDERPLDKEIVKPNSFELMKTISEQLSAGFPEARIDLYDIKGQVLFGEITFFDGSGYMTFTPDSFDEIMGNSFILPEIT